MKHLWLIIVVAVFVIAIAFVSYFFIFSYSFVSIANQPPPRTSFFRLAVTCPSGCENYGYSCDICSSTLNAQVCWGYKASSTLIGGGSHERSHWIVYASSGCTGSILCSGWTSMGGSGYTTCAGYLQEVFWLCGNCVVSCVPSCGGCTDPTANVGQWNCRNYVREQCVSGSGWNYIENCNPTGAVPPVKTCVLAGDRSSATCVVSCIPTTCSALGKNCGSWSDNCGGTLNCGSCTSPQTCNNGICQTSCTNQCTSGAKQCKDTMTTQTCGDYNGDGCMEWGGDITCASGLNCVGGSCQSVSGTTTLIFIGLLSVIGGASLILGAAKFIFHVSWI